MVTTVQGPLNNPFHNISRTERHQLTASLLRRADEATGAERDALLEQVVLVNMCVCRSIAVRYRGRGVPTEDLEQVAHMALVRCVRKYDATKDRDLLSYVVPSVRGELCRYFRDHGWTVRPPRGVQELQPRVIAQRDNGHTSTPEIASLLGVDEAEVEEALQAEGCFTPKSLDGAVGDGGATLGELLTDPSGTEGLEAAEARAVLRPVVRTLGRRDQKLLHLRFFEGLTQQEIADEMGINQTQVSRLLARILTDLRRSLGDVAYG
jgi:RNA polymerase sigma-B factor